MADLIYVLVTVGFFVGAAGFVGLCDRILGRDELPDPTAPGGPAPTTSSSSTPASNPAAVADLGPSAAAVR